MPYDRLQNDAASVLRGNDRDGTTVPSPQLYPHQWNWDSSFATIGWAHLDPLRASQELERLARGQWADGMIPHIIFDPIAANYEPGPTLWRTDGHPNAPSGVRTSSITQPPVMATAARRVFDHAGGDHAVLTILRDLVPAIERWHAWFLTTRDPSGSGVPCIVHPWESGMDNATRWDAPLSRIEPGPITYRRVDDRVIAAQERPNRKDYDRYVFLVEERARLQFAPPTREDSSFLCGDVALASILCRAEEDLAYLAEKLGGQRTEAMSRRGTIAAGLHALYDPERACYDDVDLLTGERLAVEHVAGLLPLFAGVATPQQAAQMLAKLEDPIRYQTSWPIPTIPPQAPGFEAHRYWRGPVWINVNWMIADGLARTGAERVARQIAERSLAMIAQAGFREYFDARTGEGLGADSFGWTAALAIDFIDQLR